MQSVFARREFAAGLFCASIAAALAGSTTTAAAQTYGFATLQPGTLNHTTASAVAKVLKEKAGLNVLVQPTAGDQVIVPMVARGEAEIGISNAMEVHDGLSKGFTDLRIIGAAHALRVGFFVRKDSDIRTPTDLKGKRIGLVVGATAQFGFLMMLRQHGIRIEQVTVVNMAPQAQLLALEARQIDAAMVWEPWMHRMMRSANARIVETEGNLGIYTNVDCYSVRRDWLTVNRDTALRFLRALVVANDAISKDHRVAYHAWAREVGLSNASVEAIFDVVPPPLIYEWTNPRYTYSLVKGGPLYQRLGFLAAYMTRYGIISRPVELDDAMDMSLIAEVLKGRKPP